MAYEKREPDTSLKDRLFKEPHDFSFFMAVHLIQSLFPGKKPLGKALSPAEEAVRFSVNPNLDFPPSDISSLNQMDGKRPADMEVTFMGLIGPAGALPHWYNELALERAWHKDLSLTAFMDIFHHRLVSLFYLAWQKNQWPINYQPKARDDYSGFLFSFIGLGTPKLANQLGLHDESLIFYSGLLSRSVPSAVAIEATVGHFSNTKAVVDQFVDRVIAIEPEYQTRLGMANGRLGDDAVCGSYAWENQTKFRVNLGPMGYAHFLRFLTPGDMHSPIFSLVRYIVGIEYEFEIRLILKREEVPLCTVGMETPTSPRLGWSTWIRTPEVLHREDPSVTFQEPEMFTKKPGEMSVAS
jgi:type VI secretion system protein ImpH